MIIRAFFFSSFFFLSTRAAIVTTERPISPAASRKKNIPLFFERFG